MTILLSKESLTTINEYLKQSEVEVKVKGTFEMQTKDDQEVITVKIILIIICRLVKESNSILKQNTLQRPKLWTKL